MTTNDNDLELFKMALDYATDQLGVVEISAITKKKNQVALLMIKEHIQKAIDERQLRQTVKKILCSSRTDKDKLCSIEDLIKYD